MNNKIKFSCFDIFIIILAQGLFFPTEVICDRKDIHHMMYETFSNAAMCFRILNGTNQFGCSTPQSGQTGVIQLVNNETDLTWLIKDSKAGPYMTVLPPHMFIKDVMRMLAESPKISGVLLALNGSSSRPKDMSSDDTCPNRYSSLSGSCGEPLWPWNPQGTSFLLYDWPFPLFVVKDPAVLQQIQDCYAKFNLPLDDSQLERALCSLQMTGHMYAAVNTATCMRRSSFSGSFSPITFCDPMGDQNLISQLFPRQKQSADPNGSVVLVTARLDAAAMFDGLAPGAMTTVSGIVTLLTTAHLVSQLLPEHKDSYSKNVVFALLNGEAHDYIGSSRVVYDMQRGKFPSADLPLKLEHLDQVIDMHQLDATKKVYLHCYSSSTAQRTVDLLTKSSSQFGISVEGSCSATTRLPPSSLHSFLKANMSLPGIVLTNHAQGYSNKYYNSLLDDADNLGYQYANGSEIPAASVQASLAAISQSLALSLAQMVDSNITWPSNITSVNVSSLVDELLHCYLVTRHCQLFRQLAGTAAVGEDEGPLPLYVGVGRSPNLVTSATYFTLAYLTGKRLNVTAEQCKNLQDSKANNYSYIWISGDDPNFEVCMETGLVYTPAISPAFIIENYDWASGNYSSWSESVWQELSLRMFLRPSFSQELSTLLLGLFVLLISFPSVYWLKHHADTLFNPITCDRC